MNDKDLIGMHRHINGVTYIILDIGYDFYTNDRVVIFQEINGTDEKYIMPYEKFFSEYNSYNNLEY